MALGRSKYANLPDIDDTPEIYETPELTDDASTVQTATQRTTSPTPSDEADLGRHDPDSGLDRQRIDQNAARRRFESSIVDARDVNFSESLANGPRSYKISTRRRRRRRDNGAEELGDLSDSEDESLGRKLARLKREAEEVRLEMERREQEKSADGKDGEGEEDEGLEDGVEELSQMLNGLYAPSGGQKVSAEGALSKKLSSNLKSKTSQSIPQQPAPSEPNGAPPQSSTISSLAIISDRLTALETSLGLSPTTNTPISSTPILPTLASLTSQITTLTTTLSPSSTTSTSTNPSSSTSTINLDTLTTRIRDLTNQSNTLTQSRKAATQAATDLRQARLKATSPSTVPLSSSSITPSTQPLAAETQADILAHEELTSKIHSLYATLPRIHELSPLLPVVLERLRSLQAIHNGAARASGDLEEVERRTERVEGEIAEWKAALERVEGVMAGAEEGIKGNVEVVGCLVKGVEERVARLEGGGDGGGPSEKEKGGWWSRKA